MDEDHDGSGEMPPARGWGRPAWTYFLTPAAVVIGALVIAGTIWLLDDDGGGDNGAAATAPSESTAPAGTPASEQSLGETFVGYAEDLELDSDAFQACLLDQAHVTTLNEQLQRGAAIGVGGTPTFFVNNKKIVGAQPAAVFEEVIQKEFEGGAESVDAYSAQVRALAETGRFEIVAGPIDASGAVFKGAQDSKVVIVEYSDFQCPFCKRWTEQVLPLISGRLGNDVALAFLHFPLTQIHPNAGNASLAAICAGEQGKFWEMHDVLFRRQDDWKGLN